MPAVAPPFELPHGRLGANGCVPVLGGACRADNKWRAARGQ